MLIQSRIFIKPSNISLLTHQNLFFKATIRYSTGKKGKSSTGTGTIPVLSDRLCGERDRKLDDDLVFLDKNGLIRI
jgi:hypothetical protein